jgi:hypothetical protein
MNVAAMDKFRPPGPPRSFRPVAIMLQTVPMRSAQPAEGSEKQIRPGRQTGDISGIAQSLVKNEYFNRTGRTIDLVRQNTGTILNLHREQATINGSQYRIDGSISGRQVFDDGAGVPWISVEHGLSRIVVLTQQSGPLESIDRTNVQFVAIADYPPSDFSHKDRGMCAFC